MLKDNLNSNISMKKNLCLLLMLTLLSGCFGSVAFLGPASTAASSAGGNIARGAFTSTVSYGIKNKQEKLPIEHAVAYAEEKNPVTKKEPCLSFAGKTNSKVCSIVKKQLKITKSKILKTSRDKSLKDLTSLIQPNIDKKSKIKYLD